MSSLSNTDTGLITAGNNRFNRLPAWFRQEIPDEEVWKRIRWLSESGIHTVCREAHCPNISSCLKSGKATFILLGDACTRKCRFCAVNKSAKMLSLDEEEPQKVAKIIEMMGLDYAVVTSVTRDDLEDGGARIFARTVELIHGIRSAIKVEVLIPDFKGRVKDLKCVLDAGPDLLAHNIETVRRLYAGLRPTADYETSLHILESAKEAKPQLPTKSSLMLGLGEGESEVIDAMQDLRQAECDILTLGQYLSPSKEHYPVKEFLSPQEFKRYEEIGYSLGFKAVLGGPLVRSSFEAERLYREVTHA